MRSTAPMRISSELPSQPHETVATDHAVNGASERSCAHYGLHRTVIEPTHAARSCDQDLEHATLRRIQIDLQLCDNRWLIDWVISAEPVEGIEELIREARMNLAVHLVEVLDPSVGPTPWALCG